eukprot:m51a1_g11876 putative protein rer1 (183) ;mRNA; f:565037-565842
MEQIAADPRLRSVRRWKVLVERRYQKFVDDLTPYATPRWIATAMLALLFLVRVRSLQGFFIVTYALGIYLLNLFIGFISPQVDPEEEALPTRLDDEFRPFIRHLPERKFWSRATRAILFAMVCTFLPFLDIPVFWPILVIYFFALTFVTLKNQIRHMIKHRYLPWNYGKKTYPNTPGKRSAL